MTQDHPDSAPQEYEQLYREMVDAQPFIVERYLPDTTITHVNPAAEAYYGRSCEELVGTRWIDLVPADARAEIRERLRTLTPEDPACTTEHSITRSDGSVRRIQWTDRACFDDAGHVTHFISIGMDVTEQRHAERQLGRLHDLLIAFDEYSRYVLAREPEPDALFDAMCRIAVERTELQLAWIGVPDEDGWVRPVASHGVATGYLSEAAISVDERLVEGRGPTGTALREGRSIIQPAIEAAPEMSPWHAAAARAQLRSSAALPIRRFGRVAAALNVYASEERFFGDEVMGYLENLALTASLALEAHDRRAEQRRLAYHNALTGLPNRLAVRQRLEEASATFDDGGDCELALYHIDIDKFDRINSSFGFDVGDELLVAVAERLVERLPDHLTVAHVGADEFYIVEENRSGGIDTVATSMLISETFAEPFHLSRIRKLRVSTCMGLSRCPRDTTDAQALVHYAQVALHQAKHTGPGTRVDFTPIMVADSRRRVNLDAELYDALARGELELHYQPIVTGGDEFRVTGLEALLRWQRPDGVSVSPAEFIPVAEESGLIIELGDWVIDQACRAAASWQSQGLPAVNMSVNVSPRRFEANRLAEVVDGALKRAGLAADLLTLEITESTLMESGDHRRKILDELHGLGVTIALDDFGTGYSSLAYLRELSVEVLKIDRGFTANLEHDPLGRELVAEIIRMARIFGLEVVAEGVETVGQYRYLSEAGCDSFQGFLFSRPLPASQVPALLSGGVDVHGTAWPR